MKTKDIEPFQSSEIDYFIKGELANRELGFNDANYLQVIPDSQYFTELEQIIACLQLNWNNQEYMITALKNSITMGYKLTKQDK